ncbi:MAG: hypothetical protein HY665_04160 [Chloroflexi bacterium]|nr:hypothetical protein [Chloroflexota bacterium]
MPTITETIREELLGCVNDPAAVESVLQKHSHSKGPAYTALAQATTVLTQQLKSLAEKNAAAEKDYAHRQQAIKSAEVKEAELNTAIDQKTKELASISGQLEQKKQVLGQAKELAAMGFGHDELDRLQKMLAHTAASQGAKGQDAVKLFFQGVGQYQDMTSLALEAKSAKVAAKKAKANAEQWQLQAKVADAKTKARKVTIDFAEKLMSQGVKEGDLPHWSRILSKSGLAPGNLASALEQYVSLEKLCQDRGHQAETLDTKITQLNVQADALTEKREQTGAAITSIKEHAIANIEIASEKAISNIETLMTKAEEYAKLERQAGTLEQEIALAKAFISGEPEKWHGIPRRVIRELLAGLIAWTRGNPSQNPFLPPPQNSLSSRILLCSFERVSLDEVLTWALSGIALHQTVGTSL